MNIFLRNYQSLHQLLDSWIVLALLDINMVYTWRLQAEHHMRNSLSQSHIQTSDLGHGLEDDQVRDFVDRFMPVYKLYLPALYARGPERREDTKVLKVSRARL